MKKTKKKSILSYFWKYKKSIITYISIFVIIAAIGFFASIETAKFLDGLAVGENEKALYSLIAITLVGVLSQVFYFLADIMYVKVSNKISLDIKKDLAHRVLSINSATLDHTASGTIINRIDNDPEELIGSIDGVVWSVSDLIGYFLTVFYISILNWIVGIAVGVVVLILVIVEIIRSKLYHKNSKKEKALSEPATSLTAEMIRSQKDIKTFGLEETFEEKFYTHYENFKKQSQKTSIVDFGLIRGRRGITEILVCSVMVLGLILLNQGILSVAVILYVFTNRGSINMLASALGWVTQGVASFKVAADRVGEMFDEELYPLEKYGTKNVKKLKGDITFKNVGFAYIERKEIENKEKSKKKQKPQFENIPHKVFEDLNFAIRANTTVAFTGASGSGKSTILNLICKLSDNESGEVLLDNYNIKSLSKKSIRDNVVLINQFPYIFDMTIRENIKLAKPNATDKEILKACKDANLYDYIRSLPQGLDTKIGENGVKMSGGEKQRLAIARALIKNTRIIIFDESTSSLDNASQAEITKAINKLAGKHTIIIVAHRLSTIKDVDKIYFLEKGKIIDEGTFNYLNAHNEKFKTLFLAENLEAELNEIRKNN